MNKEQEEQYPSLFKALSMSRRLNAYGIMDEFPNTIWNHGGIETMSACIGFLRGMVAAGMDMKKVDDMAKSLFRSFHFGMDDEKWEQDETLTKWDRPHVSKMLVTGTSSFLCFGFSQYHYATNQAMAEAYSSDKSCKFIGNAYQNSPREKQWVYLKGMWGGIDFHGLDETFSVCLTPTIGWQMHT